MFSGHVHEQVLYFLTPTAKLMRFAPEPGVPVPVPPHRQWLGIVGSVVGQPRDGDARAMYALFDDTARQITFYRVPYDHCGRRRRHPRGRTARVLCRQAGAWSMKLLEPGTEIDGFRVVDCIHAGGMAHIYAVNTRRPTAAPAFPWR